MRMQQSKAKQLRILFKKHKKLIKSYYETSNFKEPVIFLERRNGRVNFFENATAGEFHFDHSDGNKRTILLNPAQQKMWDYGTKLFKGYYCHEDFPVPLPEDPVITSEMFNMAIEKALHDMKKWNAKEWEGKGKFVLYIGLGIGAIILAYAMYGMFVHDPAPVAAPITQAAGNITIIGGG